MTEEPTIRGIRVRNIDEIPISRRRGLTQIYWERLFDELNDRWVNIGDLKKHTRYALSTIRIKAGQVGYTTIISEDKDWLYIKKRDEDGLP